jgi:hypothetical protein
MKKILSFLGASVYGIIFSYLLWLFFWWITPKLLYLSFGWIIVFTFAEFIVIGLFIMIQSFLFIPLYLMIRNNNLAKVIPILFFLFHGFSSFMCPIRLHPKGFLQILWTIIIEVNVLSYYIGLICLIINPKQMEE